MVISVHTNSILERTYVKIQVVCVQVLERPLQSHPGVILMRFPQFASKKYVPSRDSRVPYAFTDFLLIAWPCSAFCTWIVQSGYSLAYRISWTLVNYILVLLTAMWARFTTLHQCADTHLSEQMVPLCALHQA